MRDNDHPTLEKTGWAEDESLPFQPVFDPARYATLIEELDFTEEQKRELLQIIWNIMLQFVDLGFGTSSIQRIIPVILANSSEGSADLLESQDQTTSQKDDPKGGEDGRE